MITVEEALNKVLAQSSPLPARVCPLAGSLGCTLAEDVAADLDLPPFDKALVDGYAVRAGELDGGGCKLRIGEEIVAGRTPTRPLGHREAAAIMTGAPLPEGADAVVMIENTRRLGGEVAIDEPTVKAGMNRITRGREMRAGEVVLRRGERINAARVGLLASVGRTELSIIPRPRLTIVPTGDELVDPGQVPGPGQIRNSNAAMLRALALASGAEAEVLPIAPDEPGPLREILRRGLNADVLLITGGVSAGNRDLVPEALEDLGVERVFHKVRLRPGKPLWFGTSRARDGERTTLVFGLPGNPVSGIVGFLLFVRPALDRLAMKPERAETLRYPLARSFDHKGERATYHPARLVGQGESITIEPMDWAGSADLKTVAHADGFAVFPAGDRIHEPGAIVDFVRLG
jgi:molybdopterin molybdotransferase